jgi:hypothetical protein
MCFNVHAGEWCPIEIQDQYSAISRYVLIPSVPEHVSIHFETAKNIYLYAWFVFRFYPVAEQQALATLEFALREKLLPIITEYKNKNPRFKEPGLSWLLKTAKENSLISNEAFKNRNDWALARAKYRYSHEKMNEMIASALSEMIIDDLHIEPTAEDLTHDWLGGFVNSIPKIRNMYAHGSSTLHHSVTHTFEVISDLINYLYSSDEGRKGA